IASRSSRATRQRSRPFLPTSCRPCRSRAERYAICSFPPTFLRFRIGVTVSVRARRAPLKFRKLLVVDDDTRLLMSYRDLLSPYGFEVLTAPNGEDAIPLVEKNPDIQLVILDLMMPRMEGREWLRWLRSV